MIEMLTTIIDKTDRVRRATLAATRKWLGRVGGTVRKIARRSLKRARPMRSEEEMTDDQLDDWIAINAGRRRRGLEPLDLPERVSKPGKPPLLHDKLSPLKRLLVYHVNAEGGEVLIGPERSRSGIADRLEYGYGKQLPRPFMGPAHEKVKPQMAQWWHDAIVA